MDAVETLVRETLTEHAVDAPSADGLLTAVRERQRRRPWLAIGLAAAVVLVIAVAAVLIRQQGRDGAPAASGRNLSPSIAAPTGYRWLTFSGIAITVPAALPVRSDECALPAGYILVHTPRSPTVSCAVGGVPESEQTLTVRLDSYSPHGAIRLDKNFAARDISLHGLAGRFGYGTQPSLPGVAGQLVLPRQRIRITVTAPDRTGVDTVLRSVRPAPDLLGCAMQLRPDRGPKGVPRGAVSADACVYSTPQNNVDTRLLVAARRITGGRLERLLQIDRDLVERTGPTNVTQRMVLLELHYTARRGVTLGFLSGQAARVVTSP